MPDRGARFDLMYGAPVYLEQQGWPRPQDEVLESHTKRGIAHKGKQHD
jgi:hypothetical protein